MEYSKIILYDKHKSIVDYCLVSKNHYTILNKYKWYKANNYVLSTINNKTVRIHRYIFINILKVDITNKIIDHINRNTMDNRIENLRIVTHSENNRNRNKQENNSSNYIGVSKNNRKSGAIWTVSIRVNNKDLIAYYSNEIHAAHQYNLWCKEYNINCSNLNNIKTPDDFILYKKRYKNKELPKGICFRNNLNKYQVRIRYNNISYNLGHYTKLEDAIHVRNNKIKELENVDKLKNNNVIKKTNNNNQYIIEHFNRKNQKISESIVDEDMYSDLIKYKWSLSNNYPRTKIKGKMISLARYIMKYNGNNYIDHINNNPLDNRKENLRIVSPMQNALNKTSSKNSSSKYVGVSWYKKYNKWKSSIRINGKNKHLGYFENEIDAYNIRCVEYNKIMSQL